jgi:hypothetical protein
VPFSSADVAAFFGVGIQSAKGTPQTAQAKFRFLPYLSGAEVQAEQDVVDIREGGGGLNWAYTYKRAQKAVGNLVFYAHPEQLGQVLAIIPGGATWSGATLSASHAFHAGHASHPWATFQIGHPATSLVHFISDARFTGITIEGAAGEPIKITAPWVGITHGASSTILTPTYGVPTGSNEPFVYHYAPSYRIDGSVDSTINSWKFEHTFGIEELQAQAISLDEMVVQNKDTNVEYTLRYEDPTLWKKVNMGAAVSPTTSVATGSLVVYNQYDGGGAETNRRFEIGAYLLTYRGDTLTELDPDGKTVYQTVAGKALVGATHPLIMRLGNGHASAYGA